MIIRLKSVDNDNIIQGCCDYAHRKGLHTSDIILYSQGQDIIQTIEKKVINCFGAYKNSKMYVGARKLQPGEQETSSAIKCICVDDYILWATRGAYHSPNTYALMPVYGFHVAFLYRYGSYPKTLETVENIDLMRAIANGLYVNCTIEDR